FFQAEDGIRDGHVTGVQTCALPISDACIGGVCVHTNTCLVPKAAPTEMCGNCIDDDGNGLTDFEDPACSGQAGTLTLEEGLLRQIGRASWRESEEVGLAPVAIAMHQ